MKATLVVKPWHYSYPLSAVDGITFKEKKQYSLQDVVTESKII